MRKVYIVEGEGLPENTEVKTSNFGIIEHANAKLHTFRGSHISALEKYSEKEGWKVTSKESKISSS